MVTTETRTEQQPNYFSSRYYSTPEKDEEESFTTTYQPTNSYYTYDTTTDTEPAYEVEQEYTSSTDNAEEESEYRLVTPKFRSVYTHENALSEVKQEKQALSPRLKIVMSVASIIFVLLVAFVIYNAVSIGAINSQIASAQQEVVAQTQVINELEKEYTELGSADAIINGVGREFGFANSDNTFFVEAPTLDEVNVITSPTNWFNEVCKFFSSLF